MAGNVAVAAAIVNRQSRNRESQGLTAPENEGAAKEVLQNLRKSMAMFGGNGHRNELHDIVGHHECYSKPPQTTASGGEDANPLPQYQQKMLELVRHPAFDAVAASVIVCNAFIMGLSAEFAIQQHVDDPNVTKLKTSSFVQAASYFFFAFYVIELMIKAAAFQCAFFYGREWKWNCMDLFLVITAIYDIVEQETDFGGSNVSFLRLLRLLKMVKMLRLFRVMKFFRELRVMMYAIVGSMRLLFWALVMLGIITYIFSLIFLQGVNFKLTEKDLDEDFRNEILSYYGSVIQSMITLYEAITGGNDWAGFAIPLKECGIGYYYLFLFYIAFLTFTVLNVLTGVVVDAAMTIATLDGDNVTDEFIGEEIMSAEGFRKLAESIEINGNGYVEWDEVVSDQATETMREFLRNIDVDFEEVEGFFRLMQCQGKGNVKVKDFIKGCGNMKLWGPSKSIESFILMRNLAKLVKNVDNNFQRVLACFERQGVDIPNLSEVTLVEEPEEEVFEDFDVAAGSTSDAAPIILSGEWEQLFDECNDAEVLKSVSNRAANRIRELRQGGKPLLSSEMSRPWAGQSAQELVSRLAGLIVQEATPLLLQELESTSAAKSLIRPGGGDADPEPKMIGNPMDEGAEGDDPSERAGKTPASKKFNKKKPSKAVEKDKAAQAVAASNASSENLGKPSEAKPSDSC